MKPLIAVVTCWKNVDEVMAIRETWARGSVVPVKFFYGRGGHPPHPDAVVLDVDDSYLALPYKIQALASWAHTAGYDYLLKCDDDAYVVPNRLQFNSNHAGKWVGYLHGGAGYILSRRSMDILRKSSVFGKSEDAWVTETLNKNGIVSENRDTHSYVRRVYKDPLPELPTQHNHLAVVAEFAPAEMGRVHRNYLKSDEIDIDKMSASEYLKYLRGENR